jgi:biotin operon repressor
MSMIETVSNHVASGAIAPVIKAGRRPRLSDAALVLLGSAASRDDGMLLPPPAGLAARGAALEKLCRKLLAGGLVEEVVTTVREAVWRTGEDDTMLGLRITPAGCRAIGVAAEETGAVDEAAAAGLDRATDQADYKPALAAAASDIAPTGPAAMPPNVPPPGATVPANGREGAIRAGSKTAGLVKLLQGEGRSALSLGADLGWLPHTVRAALTGLRQRGIKIERSRNGDGVAIYRIPDTAAALPSTGGEVGDVAPARGRSRSRRLPVGPAA